MLKKYFLHNDISKINKRLVIEYKILLLTILISSIAMIAYIFYAIHTDLFLIASILTFTLGLNVISVIILKTFSPEKSKMIAGNIFSGAMLILFLSTFIISFTKSSPAIVWFAIYPLISIFSTNIKYGIIWSLTFSLLGLITTYYMTTNHLSLGLYTDKNIYIATLMNIIIAPLVATLFIKSSVQLKNNAIIDLQKSLDQNKKLLSILSHDISNPLQIISMLTEQFSQRLPEPVVSHSEEASLENYLAQQNLIAEKINKSTKVMLEITKQVKSQIKNNYCLEYKIEEVKIINLFDDILFLFEEQFANKQITFTGNSQEFLHLSISSNKSALFNNVIQNIISNAIKFTKNNGQINFNVTELNHREIQIKIQDNGVGIQAKDLEDLSNLENHHDIINSTIGTNGEIGTGLGLSIIFKTLQQIGGSIHVSSSTDKERCGTSIELTFQKYI